MVKALVFDAYGTLFDVHSVLGRCDEVFPSHGFELTSLWRLQAASVHLAAISHGQI